MNATATRRPRLRELMPPHRIVISLVLAVAIGLLWLGFTESRDGGVVVRPTRPAAIPRVFPVEQGLGLRQEPIGFELAVGYTGELQVDGRDIPLDQLVRPQPPAPNDNTPANRGLAGLNQFSFTPGKGQDIEELAPGEHRATALYWREEVETRDQAATYSWTFRVS